MTANTKISRRPLGNFFLKKALQFRIILSILFIFLLSSTLMIGILAYTYQNQSKNGTFYYMSNDIMQDLQLKTILGIILPAMVSAQVASLLIAIGIGMFSSRKVAVPIYKLEQWASEVRLGRFKTKLAFRETRSMNDLTMQFNELTSMLRTFCSDIEGSVARIEAGMPQRPPHLENELMRLHTTLARFDYKE